VLAKASGESSSARKRISRYCGHSLAFIERVEITPQLLFNGQLVAADSTQA